METGCRLFKREIIQSIQLHEDRAGFESELMGKLARSGCRIYEVGISYCGSDRKNGKKVKARDWFRTLYCTVKYGLSSGAKGPRPWSRSLRWQSSTLIVTVVVLLGVFANECGVESCDSFRAGAPKLAPAKSFLLKGGGRELFHARFELGIIGTGKDFDPVTLGDTFSVEVVGKPASGQVPYAHLLGNHPGFSNFEGFAIQQEGGSEGTYAFGFGNGKAWLPPKGVPISLPPGRRFHLTVVVAKSTISVFKDGALVGSADATDALKNSAMQLSIGNWQGRDRPFNGTIDEVRITEGALPVGDIQRNADSVL
jgi:hypothetical protein